MVSHQQHAPASKDTASSGRHISLMEDPDTAKLLTLTELRVL